MTTKSLDDFLPAEPKPERGKDDGDGADEPQGATIPPPQVDSVILSSPETPWEDAFGRPADVESKVAIEKYGFVPTSLTDFSMDDRWDLKIPRELMDRVEIKHARGLVDPGPDNWSHGEFRASKFNSGLCRFLVRYYTEPGWRICDSFAGWGTRGYVCMLLGRKYIGWDVAEDTVKAVNAALEKVRQTSLDGGVAGSAVVYFGDGLKMAGIPDESFDALITCPPYHNRELYQDVDRSIGYQLSRVDLQDFETLMMHGFERWDRVLRPGALAVFVYNDWRENGRIYPFGYKLMTWAFKVGWNLHDVVVHRLRGVTSMGIGVFMRGKFTAKGHETILVFRKPGDGVKW